ncbi:MAG: hypothetical protein MAG795_00900 [Candidatus Woesearchaeota archaeon]|nr:hypothetical protein [Candidatus Woesearchaeota archaeon]
MRVFDIFPFSFSDQREDLKFSAMFRRKIFEFESPNLLSILCKADNILGVPAYWFTIVT